MKSLQLRWFLISALLLSLAGPAFAQGTAFTYHGRLNDNGGPASGSYDLTFAVFGAETGSHQGGSTLTNSAVAVTNGLFAVTLDFGPGVFDGQDRWLEMGVRPSGNAAFTPLTPRQRLTPTPYAITACNLTGTLEATQLTGTMPPSVLGGGRFTRTFIFDNPANSFTGDGAGLNDVDAAALGGLGAESFWKLGGNSGTTAGADFLGTTDHQPLELKVNGQRAFRLEPTTNSPNVIGGFQGNYAGSNVIGVTIGGGGADTQQNFVETGVLIVGPPWTPPEYVVPQFGTIGGGAANAISAGSYATIAGGASNSIWGSTWPKDGVDQNTIGGGANSHIANSRGSTIAGGFSNAIHGQIYFEVGYSTIGGGAGNSIDASSDPIIGATIAGGVANTIRKMTSHGTIGGGSLNLIDQQVQAGTIAGGSQNTISVGSGYASIAGGLQNKVHYFCRSATIAGGTGNIVSAASGTICGGSQAKASKYGQMAYASGAFADVGDAQTSVYVCRGITTNGTQIELFLDGASQRMVVPPNTTWAYDILVTGRAANGDSAAYQIRGAIKNNAGTTTMVGWPDVTVLAEDVPAWDATAYAGDTNDVLLVDVTGTSGANIRWVASVRTVEVSF